MESKSVKRRKAAQRGEPAPQFDKKTRENIMEDLAKVEIFLNEDITALALHGQDKAHCHLTIAGIRKILKATEQAVIDKLAGVTDEKMVEIIREFFIEYSSGKYNTENLNIEEQAKFKANIILSKLSAVHNARLKKAVEQALFKHCNSCNLFLQNAKRGGS